MSNKKGIAMRKIGNLYLNTIYFVDEANKTIGKPALSPEIMMNRRCVTPRVTDAGKLFKTKVAALFQKKYNLDVKLKWNIHCGCNMCPCSPGFDIVVDLPDWKFKEDDRITVWVDENGTIDFREPRDSYTFAHFKERYKNKKVA